MTLGRMDALMAAYQHRRTRELREMAGAMSYAHHAPDQIADDIVDPVDLQDEAEARGFETDTEAYWD